MSSFTAITDAITNLRSLSISEEFEAKDMFLFKRATAYIEYRVKVSDDFITLPSLIEEVAKFVGSSETELRNYINSKNEANFTSAETQILNAAKASLGFAQVLNQNENTYLLDALKSNDETISKLNQLLTELHTELTCLQGDSSALIKNLTDEFKKLVDGGDGTIGWKKQVSDALTQIETEFHQELFGSESGKKGWVDKANEVEQQLTSILSDGIQLGRIIGVNGLTKIDRQAQQLSFMQIVKQRCSNLLSIMGLGASVGGYQDRANSERLSGMLWTACIVGIFIGLVCFNADLLDYFDEYIGNQIIYQFLLFRLIASLPFVAFMTFAGFKAKSHRTMELKYRQFALELATFEPNLQGVDQDIRGYAKLLFIQKTFGNTDPTGKPEEMDLEAMKKNIESFKSGVASIKELIDKK